MIRNRSYLDTTNPPGQIVNKIPNLEMPLGRAIEAFKQEEIDGLRGRVHELEKELKYMRSKNLELYLELENKHKNFSNF